jgi:hypothetical protein
LAQTVWGKVRWVRDQQFQVVFRVASGGAFVMIDAPWAVSGPLLRDLSGSDPRDGAAIGHRSPTGRLLWLRPVEAQQNPGSVEKQTA